MLFATDLDGTLLGPDGRVRPRDAEAIADARARGVRFTIATGRLTSGTFPIADALAIAEPMICADGGITACGATKAVLHGAAIARMHADTLLETFAREGFASFVFTHDTIHSCERGTPLHGYVRGWSPSIVTVPSVLDSPAWREDPHGPVMLVGVGSRDKVDALAAHMDAAMPDVEHLTFPVRSTELRVTRIVARGVSKGAALAALAARLGVERERVAVAGDWHNDVSMMQWAGRSFAMPHAPAEVKQAATDELPEEAYRDGAIAAALERWMADHGL
jgi:Cof subfamily protein (haloacid dehalogenase superfamily)